MSRRFRRLLYVLGTLAAVAVAMLGIMTTGWFQRTLACRLIASLEGRTGGPAELKEFRFSPTIFEVTLRGLVLHGRRLPTESPFFSARTIVVGIDPLSLVRRRLTLRSLEWDEAEIRLYTRPDGSTNLPEPKVPLPPGQVLHELIDWSIERLTLARTQFFWNEQRVPLELRAQETAILLRFQPSRRYSGSVSSSEMKVQAHRWSLPPVAFTARFEFSSTIATVPSFKWQCAGLKGEGALTLQNPPSPEGRFSFRASGEISELARALGFRQMQGGSINWEGAGTYRQGAFVAQGRIRARRVRFRSSGFRLDRVDLAANYSVDPPRVELSDLIVTALGGSVHGGAEISLNGPSPGVVLRAQLVGLDLAAILQSFSDAHTVLGRLPLDSRVDGIAELAWSGQPEDLRSQFNLRFRPQSSTGAGSYPLGGSMRGSARIARGLYLQLQEAEFHTPHSTLTAKGILGAEKAALTVQFATSDFEEWRPVAELLARTAAPIPLTLKSKAMFSGAVGGPIHGPEIRGRVEVGPFRYHGWDWDEFSGNLFAGPPFIQICSGELRSEKSRLTFQAETGLTRWKWTPDAPVSIQAHAQGTPLEGLKSAFGIGFPLGGLATGRLALNGTASHLFGQGELHIEPGWLAGEPIDSVSATVRVADSVWHFDRVQLAKGHGQLKGQARVHPSKRAFWAELHGTDFSLGEFRRLAPPARPNSPLPVDGRASFDLRGEGTPEDVRLLATWSVRNLRLGGSPLGDLQGRLAWQGQRMRLEGDAQGPGGVVRFTAEARTEGDWPLELTGQYTNLRLEPWIRALRREKFDARVAASGALSVRGPVKDPGKLEVRSQAQSLEVSFPSLTWKNENAIEFHYADGTLTASRFRMRGPSTDLEVEGAIRFGEPPALSAFAQGKADAALLSLIDPALQATGLSELELRASGTAAQPLLYGTVKVQDVSLGYRDFPLRITGLKGELALEGERASARSLRGASGGGNVVLTGFATHAGTPRFDARLDLEDVRAQYPANFTSVFDGSLRFTGTAERGQISGELTIRQLLAGEHMNLLSPISEEGGSAGRTTLAVASPLARALRLNIQVRSAPAVRVETRELSLVADIDLRIQGTLANPVEVGTVHILRGEAVFRGNRYRLTRGDISMTNPFRTERVLNLEAQTRVQRYDLTLDISGPVERLKIAYRADPPLPTADILSLLAFGYSRQYEEMSTAPQPLPTVGASALLSEALSSTVSGRIQRLFGVSRIKVDPNVGPPGSTGGARVTVEQQVTRDFTLTYVTNTASSQQRIIQFEWVLSDSVSLIGERDQNGIFGMELKFRRRFK